MAGGISDIIDITVRASNPGVTRAGFGVPLILSQNATFPDVTRIYSQLSDVQADFGPTTPEYAAASRLFSQSPAVKLVRIGKAPTNPVLQRWSVAVVLAATAKTYKLKVWLADGTVQTVEYATTVGSTKGTTVSAQVPTIWISLNAFISQFKIKVDGGAAEAFQFGANGGWKIGAAGVFAGTTGVFVVRVDGNTGSDQTIHVAAADNTQAKIIDKINTQAQGFTVFNDAGQLYFQSSRFGSGSRVDIISGDAGTLTDLGVTVGVGTAGQSVCQKVGGSGAVAVPIPFFDSATPQSIVDAIALCDGGLTGGLLYVNANGALAIETDTTGPGGSIQVDPTSTDALGFDTAVHAGTTGAGATNDEIMQGLLDALAGLADPPDATASLVGSVGSKTLQVVADATTVWFAMEIDDPTLLKCVQNHAAPTGGGLATDIDSIANSSTDWYGIISLYNSPAYIAAVAAKCETLVKQYVPASAETISAITAAAGGTDELKALKALNYNRTGGFFHPRAAEFPDAAEMGRFFPIDPGGDNWRLKTLVGVASGWGNGQQFTATQVQNLQDRNANYYYNLAGVDVIGGAGKEASGRFIDFQRGLDWYVARLGERLANLLIQSEKVPFTDAGISLVESEVRAQNQEGISVGLINPGSPPGIPAPVVTVPKAGEVDPALRAARTLPNVNTTWTPAGAINKILVNVAVTP